MQEMPPDNVRVYIFYAAWNIKKEREWEAEVRSDLSGRPGRRWVIFNFYGAPRAYPSRDWQPDRWRFKDGR